MLAQRDKIARNLDEIREQIATAAAKSGRTPDDVRLIAVTKSVPVAEAEILAELGIAHLGENRVDVAKEKIDALGDAVSWHMIGHIQRRKAKDVVRLFDYIDSVDRLTLAEELDSRCEAAGKALPVLLEVNVSGEEAKHGMTPEDLPAVMEAVSGMPHLDIRGVMTMAPFVDDAEETRPVFAALRELGAQLGVTELSMGMSNDFRVAIEEGATEIRIGTALFQ